MEKLKIFIWYLLSLFSGGNLGGHLLRNVTETSQYFRDFYLREYVANALRQTDRTVNPCSNFTEYACGRLQLRENKTYFALYEKIDTLTEHLFTYEPPKTIAEWKLFNFFESCKYDRIEELFRQVDVLHFIKYWPETGRYINNRVLAKLLAELIEIAEFDLLQIEINSNIIVLRPPYHIPKSLKIEEIRRNIVNFEVPIQIALDIAMKIENFYEKFKIIFRNAPETSQDVTLSLWQLKREIPFFDWDVFFGVIFERWNMPLNATHPKIHVQNFGLVKETLSLVRQIDVKYVVDYLAWRFIQLAKSDESKCPNILEYFRPVVMAKFYRVYSQREDEEKQLTIKKLFEKSFAQVIKRIGGTHEEKIKFRKQFPKNFTKILQDEIYYRKYADLKISPRNYFQNVFNIRRQIESTKHLNILPDATTAFDYKRLIRNRNKPMLYYFVTEYFDLWKDKFEKNEVLQRGLSPSFSKCLEKRFKSRWPRNYPVWEYPNSIAYYAAGKQSFLDYEKYLKASPSNVLFREREVLGEFNMNHLKAFFLLLTQNQCMQIRKSGFRFNEVAVFLMNFKEFSREYHCYEGDIMNSRDKCEAW